MIYLPDRSINQSISLEQETHLTLRDSSDGWITTFTVHGTAHHQSATENQPLLSTIPQTTASREMVRRATPAPALDKNRHPLHVFPTRLRLVRRRRTGTRHPPTMLLCSFGTPRVTSAHNWLERRGKFSMPAPPCAGRPGAQPLAHWCVLCVMSDQSSLTRCANASVLLYASSMIRRPDLFFGRIRRTSNYITIIPTSILICGRDNHIHKVSLIFRVYGCSTSTILRLLLFSCLLLLPYASLRHMHHHGAEPFRSALQALQVSSQLQNTWTR